MTPTTDQLRSELRTLAVDAPPSDQIRAALAARITARTRRRRTVAVVAASLTVVLIGGGAAVVGGVFADRDPQPAVQEPVVRVPQVPLPADTALIRHDLSTVTSPVTNGLPGGLDTVTWSSFPGRLAVTWFDRDLQSDAPAGGGWLVGAGQNANGAGAPRAAGYLITDAKTLPLTASGPHGIYEPDTERAPVTVGGHPAELVTAPDDATDGMGLPAARRITWQLSGGQWIHVWAGGEPVALQTFADTFTETPETLYRSVGVGVTLPGLTADWSINPTVIAANSMASVALCPAGVDPYPGTSADGNGSTVGLGPGGTSPMDPCLQVTVTTAPRESLDLVPATTVEVDGATVHLTEELGAWRDLGDGAIAFVNGPTHPELSDADVAAVAASVRLAPSIPVTAAMPEDQSDGSFSWEEAASSSAAGDESLAVLHHYLNALVDNDCALASTWTAESFANNGELCGSARVTAFDTPQGPATPADGELGYAVLLTSDGSTDGTVPPGDVLWFYTLRLQDDGRWLITGAGSGP